MDYVVGSVAALISGNVTPNRPKIVRRALTPTKHQPSPNVTPKSEFVEDRSIFLSPTQQKKKAIVKKSPKRIFQNPDLDATDDGDSNYSLASPKAEKVKKHLKEELEADSMSKKQSQLSKSPCSKLNKSSNEVSTKKKSKIIDDHQVTDNTPKKKKKRSNSESNVTENHSMEAIDSATSEPTDHSNIIHSKVKTLNKKHRKSISEIQAEDAANTVTSDKQEITSPEITITTPASGQEGQKRRKNKKKNKKHQDMSNNTSLKDQDDALSTAETLMKKKKKKKINLNANIQADKQSLTDIKPQSHEMNVDDEYESESEEIKSRNIPNPNAITEKDTDSEHDSDNEIESENEQDNVKVNENEPAPSSDEEEENSKESSSKKKKQIKEQDNEVIMSEEEIKRTLFVGNVPFSNKCKKEIKKIFNKYGKIDTIRIRTIPVKDARVTPKLAVIKNELHPDRTTVNVYIKYSDPTSVKKALVENNTVLNGNHLRVSPSDSTGAEHDPHCAVFVGNLPFAIEDDTLRSKFEKCGEISSVRIIRDKKTNAGKGFGYVNFVSKDGVELALALSEEDLTIKNRILRVKRCASQKPGGGKPGVGGKWNSQGHGGGNRGNQGQGRSWGNQRQGGGKWGNQGPEGAARRLMKKRKFQEGVANNEGPPNKIKKNVNQSGKEKKQKKEFVGVTAEKKKKQKFNKGQKKKKALSEILTK